MTLKKREFDEGYEYLSRDDSKLYDKVKDSLDPKDLQIKRLLEEKANDSRSAHIRDR